MPRQPAKARSFVFVTGYGREGLPQAFNSDVYMQNGRERCDELARAAIAAGR